jgi:hypothetical protein
MGTFFGYGFRTVRAAMTNPTCVPSRSPALTPRRVRAACLLLGVLASSACAASKPQEPPRDGAGHRTIAEGYSLLYGIVSQQKDLKKLLLIKIESDPVDRAISAIADYAGELTAKLEDMAARYPALTVETQFLPEVEVKTRESIAAEAQDTFLSKSGKEFERELLLKQRSALEQEQHMAKVMVTIETAEERRAFWRGVEKRFGALRGDVDGLLRRTYFCN